MISPIKIHTAETVKHGTGVKHKTHATVSLLPVGSNQILHQHTNFHNNIISIYESLDWVPQIEPQPGHDEAVFFLSGRFTYI